MAYTEDWYPLQSKMSYSQEQPSSQFHKIYGVKDLSKYVLLLFGTFSTVLFDYIEIFAACYCVIP